MNQTQIKKITAKVNELMQESKSCLETDIDAEVVKLVKGEIKGCETALSILGKNQIIKRFELNYVEIVAKYNEDKKNNFNKGKALMFAQICGEI